jgi:predicted transcriptional regulator
MDMWELRLEMQTLYNLARMVKELRLYEHIAKELNIKASSVRRQLDRLAAYYEQREKVQKRSGKRKGKEYEKTMWKTLERLLGRKINPFCLPTARKVLFDRLEDALNYTKPISNIAGIVYDWENSVWVVCIPKGSDLPMTPYEA